MREPGGLTALGTAGSAAWSARVTDSLARALESAPAGARYVRPSLGDEPSALTGPDWTGFPVRVLACLGRKRALELLDWHTEDLGDGGRAFQDEYIEWRTVRSEDGGISRVELTTELPEYWGVLAAYEPERLLELVSKFAGETSVAANAVYGSCDPFAAGATPEGRERAFSSTMLAGRSPYNNGERAICCMVQRTNSLDALASLTAAATSARVVRDAVGGRLRCLTCSEAIPLLSGVALRGRGSDPVLVERLGRLAYEGRLVSFDDPLGVYMQAVEHTRLRTPVGDAVPPEWFTFSRGLPPEALEDGHSRYQRLTFCVPETKGFCVSDLIDVATEQPVRSGGEIADLVQLAVFFRVSEPGKVTGQADDVGELEPEVEDSTVCAEILEHEQRFDHARRLR